MIVPLQAAQAPLCRIAQVVGSEAMRNDERVPKRLVTHSAEVEPGDLFCALKGETDGHLFAAEAAARGAVAVLAERPCHDSLPHILVQDVPAALALWGRATLDQVGAKVIAITGSVGKTTTKDITAAVLGSFFHIHATKGNRNNLLGVPLTLLEMPKKTDWLIAECGMNARGEIETLSRLLHPDIAVITNIGTAHIGPLGSRRAIAGAKTEILLGMKEDGYVLYPDDEPLLSSLRERPGKAVSPFTATAFSALTNAPLPPDIGLRSALRYAYEIGCLLGIEERSLGFAIAEASLLSPHKSIRVCAGVTLIEDAYNASPESVKAALFFLSHVAKGRRIALLGDMLELGAAAEELHFETGKAAGRATDLLFCYGDHCAALARGATQAGGMAVPLSADPAAAAAVMVSFLKPGDTLLAKASHRMRADLYLSEVEKELKKIQ